MSIRKDLIEKGEGEPPRLSRWEILQHINRCKGSNVSRDKALIAFLYLTGARVEEVVKYVKEGVVVGTPIIKEQLIINDKMIRVEGVRCLKRRLPVRRDIPIVKRERDKEFITIIVDYINELEDQDKLFDIRREYAYRILAKVGLYCHYMRHLRLTHLASEDNFSDMHLRKFVGWKDTRPASIYAHLNIEDLTERMRDD